MKLKDLIKLAGEDAEITILCEEPGSGEIGEMDTKIFITQSMDEIIIAPNWYTPDRYSGLIKPDELEKMTQP